jgi:hypothetical protein
MLAITPRAPENTGDEKTAQDKEQSNASTST